MVCLIFHTNVIGYAPSVLRLSYNLILKQAQMWDVKVAQLGSCESVSLAQTDK